MDDLLSKIPDAMEVRNCLPRPKWEVIGRWVVTNVEADSLESTWTGIARDWLGRLAQALSAGYAVHESPDFMLLTADAKQARRVLSWCEHARRQILEKLDNVASDDGYGKHVVLVFADMKAYYDYISVYYPDEGEFGLSGGIFLPDGYGHFAISAGHHGHYERTIAHEMTHVLLQHLPLPLWLNEGVTQFMEDLVLGASYFSVEYETLRLHRGYWNENTIHAFWSGDSFYYADDGQKLSYHLAQVLFRNLVSDYPRAIKEILKQASFRDAGNAAIVRACKVTLADMATQFLGQGEWAPRPDYAPALRSP